MSIRQEDFHPGETLGARELNAIRDELARLARITFVPPLCGAIDGAGIAVWHSDPQPGMWIKLTSGGSGGKYAWTLQKATAGGGWADDDSGMSGTASVDFAYEENANTSVPVPSVVRARRNGAGVLVFQSGSC